MEFGLLPPEEWQVEVSNNTIFITAMFHIMDDGSKMAHTVKFDLEEAKSAVVNLG